MHADRFRHRFNRKRGRANKKRIGISIDCIATVDEHMKWIQCTRNNNNWSQLRMLCVQWAWQAAPIRYHTYKIIILIDFVWNLDSNLCKLNDFRFCCCHPHNFYSLSPFFFLLWSFSIPVLHFNCIAFYWCVPKKNPNAVWSIHWITCNRTKCVCVCAF